MDNINYTTYTIYKSYVGINTKIGIVDLMEDHRVYGGFRLGGSMSEYSLNYQNLKRKWIRNIVLREENNVLQILNPFDIKNFASKCKFNLAF